MARPDPLAHRGDGGKVMVISCAKTNLPILGGPDWAAHPFSRAVLLREGRPPVAGCFDGIGFLGAVDLKAAGVLDEIRAGTASLVLDDHYRAGDTPSGLGPSRIEAAPEAHPTREFVAACARVGPFATYDGYVLAREGKVAPEVGAALKAADIAVLARAAAELRQAIAKRLAALAPRSSRPVRDIERLVAPLVGLGVVPLDAECRRFRLSGGPGLAKAGIPVQFGLRDLRPSALKRLATDLLGRFPPRKKASALLTSGDEPVGVIALYDAPELGVSLYVSWTPEDIGMFGTAEQAVTALGLAAEEAEPLAATVYALGNGHDATVVLQCKPGRRF